MIQATKQFSPHTRLGAELEFRNYETEFFNAKNVDTRSYILRGIGQYFFRPHGISPYVGLGLDITINDWDGDEVERKEPSVDVKTGWGFGYGITGLLGVEAPVSQELAFFVEGRVSANFTITTFENQANNTKINIESLSGLTGMGGLRMRF